MTSPSVRQFYETYDFERIVTGGPPLPIQHFLDGEIAFLQQHIPAGRSLLEVGCGYGRLLALLQKDARRIAGIDFSRPLLERAKKKLAGCSTVELYLMHAESITFPDNQFDYVMCLDATFGNMPGLEAAVIGQMARVCKHDGEVILSVFSEHARDAQLANYRRIGLTGIEDDGVAVRTAEGFYSRRFTQHDLRALVNNAGLNCEIISICPINYIVVARTR